MKTEELKKYKAVAICGYRNKGRALFAELQKQGMSIAYIIERNYEALRELERNLNVQIVGFDRNHEFYRQAEVILLSGDLPEVLVKECVEMVGIDIPVINVDLE